MNFNPVDSFKTFLSIIFVKSSVLRQGCTSCNSLAARNWERLIKWRGNGERMRKWRENGQRMMYFPHFLFISPLSIHFLYQKLSHFVTKRFKIDTALLSRMSRENNSGSNSLQESSSSCDGLCWDITGQKRMTNVHSGMILKSWESHLDGDWA